MSFLEKFKGKIKLRKADDAKDSKGKPCHGLRRFEDVKGAIEFSNHYRDRNFKAFDCPDCKFWHVK